MSFPRTSAPAARAAASVRCLSSTTSPKWRCASGGCVRPDASAMNWSPRSMKAMRAPRPRRPNSKMRPYHASASSMSPTSSATWLIPTRRPWSAIVAGLGRRKDDPFGLHVADVRRGGLLEPDVLALTLGQVPAVLQDLVEELGRLELPAQVTRHVQERRLEDLLAPAVRRQALGERAPLLLLERRTVARDVVQQPPCLVLLRPEAREVLEPPPVVARLDDLWRQAQPVFAVL